MSDRSTKAVDPVSSAGSDLTNPAFTNQLLSALAAGVEVELYLSARAADITHAEIMSALKGGNYLDAHIDARSAGATLAETKELLNALPVIAETGLGDDGYTTRMALHAYAEALRNGATHAECLDARSRHLHLFSYADSRGAGAAHKELIQAIEAGISMGTYAWERRMGANQHAVVSAPL
jgi:hypothetical protein